ncbi:two-component system KDP operon response regulator KdpE [Angulomicrobium tetraedrale]|uniref:Two-component system KDP operon response regulator KdpE n=1 Tax=Ancylobacter tetraedralis TaxID=217068 RepID=A0A839Z7H1_9HYPH|nr:response regulator [Ancylobacter tetraedralis]MBB3770128.1 two-component system KDP operon response regulator KdpE [Ancylobacter tetraedralis]
MSGVTVLVVDDEPAIHRFMAPALAANGYEALRADTGAEALSLVVNRRPAIVILDLGLPDMDGKDVIRSLRGWSDVPIVVLSARDREIEKIEALDLGADDFVNKPFSMGELMARLRAALRHRMQEKGETPILRLGDVEIDIPRHRVLRAGAEVKLTPKEFELIAFLARHAGKVLTHRHILREVWGPANEHDTQYLRVYVGQLRAKLEADPANPVLIVTEPGVGYRTAA